MNISEILNRLSVIDSTCLCDANKSLRTMAPDIRPVCSGLMMVGIARTAKCQNDFLTVVESLKNAETGEVIVVDTSNGDLAFAGELFANEAKRKGLSGIIIDSPCRDIDGIQKASFPLYCRGVRPMAGACSEIQEMQTEIQCGGISVSPEDIVVGDDNGIVVLTEEEARSALPRAEQIYKAEKKILKRINEGQSLFDNLSLLSSE